MTPTSSQPSTTAAVVQGRVMEPADLVKATTLAVPGVTSLHAGAMGAAATYLPGRRVAGIALRDGGTEVHVVLAAGADIRGTAARIQTAVAALAPAVALPVHVYIEDLAIPA